MLSEKLSDAFYSLRSSVRRINPWREEIIHSFGSSPEPVKDVREWRRNNAPVSLPAEQDRRPLTPIDGNSFKGQPHDQLQSRLFSKLPVEIRFCIYGLVLADRPTHIVQHFRGRRLGYVRCLKKSGEPDVDLYEEFYLSSYHRLCRGTQWRYRIWLRPHPDAPIPWTDSRMLALVKTCKRIYTEALPVLYKQGQFHFASLDNVIYLERTTRPCRFSSISWVFLDHIVEPLLYEPRTRNHDTPKDEATWEQACGVLAAMHGLRHLHISLSEGHHEPTRERSWEQKVLKPLGSVCVKGDFLLELSWKTREVHLPEIEGPFRIVRFDWWSHHKW